MIFLESLPLNIAETPQDLQTLLQQQTQPHLRERVAALYLLKLGKVKDTPDLAKTIGRDPRILEQWFRVYETQGVKALLQVPTDSTNP